MLENGTQGLLVRAEPLWLAEEISRKLVDVVRIIDGALLLDADPTWAGAVNTVLVKKSVRVNELDSLSWDAVRSSASLRPLRKGDTSWDPDSYW